MPGVLSRDLTRAALAELDAAIPGMTIGTSDCANGVAAQATARQAFALGPGVDLAAARRQSSTVYRSTGSTRPRSATLEAILRRRYLPGSRSRATTASVTSTATP